MLPVVPRICAIELPVPFVAPDTPACTTVQSKVVPTTELDSTIPVVDPSQIVSEAGVAITSGVGLTVTTTSIEGPVQPFAVGVIV